MKRCLAHVSRYSTCYIKRCEAVLNDLPGDLYVIDANGKTPDNCKYPLATFQAAQNQIRVFKVIHYS